MPEIKRLKLTITQVSEPQKVKDRDFSKIALKAKDSDGQEHEYSTIKSSLFPKIVVGQTIDADVESKTWGTEERGGINHNIVQIYEDGQAVATKGGRVWQSGESPEQFERKQTSIERQVALEQAVERSIARSQGKEDIMIVHLEAERNYAWLQNRPPQQLATSQLNDTRLTAEIIAQATELIKSTRARLGLSSEQTIEILGAPTPTAYLKTGKTALDAIAALEKAAKEMKKE